MHLMFYLEQIQIAIVPVANCNTETKANLSDIMSMLIKNLTYSTAGQGFHWGLPMQWQNPCSTPLRFQNGPFGCYIVFTSFKVILHVMVPPKQDSPSNKKKKKELFCDATYCNVKHVLQPVFPLKD